MNNIIITALILMLSLTGCGAASTESKSLDNTDGIYKQTIKIDKDSEQLDDKQEGQEVEKELYYCNIESCPGHILENISSSDELPVCNIDTSFTIDMTFVGDCMLATYKGQYYDGSFSQFADTKEPTYFFEKVYDIFSSDDFTIANLENVLTDNKLTEVKKNHDPAYWYKAPTKNTDIITSSSIEIVSLANNHTGDYGEQGKKDTIQAITDAGIPYGYNDKTVYFEKNGFKIALICHGLWYEGQSAEIIKRIQEASEQSDYQIVFYHGGTERIHKPEEWKVRESRRLVDGGADLVIGNHPHVLQPAEVYNGVNIVYSLGNFCFGGNKKPENRTIIYKIKLTIDNGEIQDETSEIIPCYVYTGATNNWQPSPITDSEEVQKVLDFMNGQVELPY